MATLRECCQPPARSEHLCDPENSGMPIVEVQGYRLATRTSSVSMLASNQSILVFRFLNRSCGLGCSPVTIQTPSKPLFILCRIVGIEIDVDAGYSAIAKFENVAETSARSFATRPGFTGYFPL